MRRKAATVLCATLFLFVAISSHAQNSIAKSEASVDAAALSAQSSSARPIQHVLIVTVDGMKPETYTEPDTHGLKVPTLREMVRNGASSQGVQSVMPTITYPSHTAMVTGANPGTTGIYTNIAWDPLGQNSGGWRWYTEDIRVPTLWQVARQEGLKTALIHWPVTAGAQADINIPEYWRASIPEDMKLVRALSTGGIFEKIAAEFPSFKTDVPPLDLTDPVWTDAACYAIENLKPNLLLLHLAMVDHWEHEKGPFSPEANAATETADAQIARLISSAKKTGTWQTTVLVILSDHGFAPISQEMRPGVLLKQKDLITLDTKGRITDWKAAEITDGGSAYIYVKDPSDDATRAALHSIFDPLVGAEGSGIRRIASHDQIVAMGGDPNAFLALEASDGTSFAFGYTGDLQGKSRGGGTHGYFPDRKEMRASMIIYGPAIGPGKIDHGRLIDVAPTVAEWLGLKLDKTDGSPLAIPMAAAAATK
ncbi:MAG TPA: alkaline phosphatase family protein [Candidatus Acidoferrales bacterium]|nr:alkaline phosphatase family protein [Candidatus Acidoferrales bacterium]